MKKFNFKRFFGIIGLGIALTFLCTITYHLANKTNDKIDDKINEQTTEVAETPEG